MTQGNLIVIQLISESNISWWKHYIIMLYISEIIEDKDMILPKVYSMQPSLY